MATNRGKIQNVGQMADMLLCSAVQIKLLIRRGDLVVVNDNGEKHVSVPSAIDYVQRKIDYWQGIKEVLSNASSLEKGGRKNRVSNVGNNGDGHISGAKQGKTRRGRPRGSANRKAGAAGKKTRTKKEGRK
jgi:hypothetical protein